MKCEKCEAYSVREYKLKVLSCLEQQLQSLCPPKDWCNILLIKGDWRVEERTTFLVWFGLVWCDYDSSIVDWDLTVSMLWFP